MRDSNRKGDLSKMKKTICALVFVALFAPLHFGKTAGNKDRTLTVMTRNMYLGTDFGGVFAAQSPPQLLSEVAEAYANVQASNPPARVAAVADEIADEQPALVSLQEVALWQTGAFLDPSPATNVQYDYLQLLLDDLSQRGMHYAPVAVLTNFEAEAPALGAAGAFDVRFTDRLVLLARTDQKTSQFKLENVSAQHFNTNLTLPTPTLGALTIPRGWIAADVKTRGKTYRFVATHLESFYQPVGYVQATELLAGPANTTLPVVMAGDFNADAGGADPSTHATYQLLLSGSFLDAWAETHPNDPGFTWPLFLTNPFAYVSPSQRIDLVLTRGGVEPEGADVVGEENVTPTKPMPSDHAGLVATLKLLP
jgi:endonuclease/exonuclease/phosphatase family metal-dependent hydrolase